MAGKLTSKTAGTVLYLYGVTQSAPSTLPKIVGVDGSTRVEAISCSGLTCWISRVSASEFADELARNMENLDWLSEKSVAHQRAVSSISEVADILPTRFGTVFLGEESLQADMKRRKREIQSDFKRIGGSDEWGVKVFALPTKVIANSPGKITGRDYLRAKSQVLHSKAPAKSDQEVERFDSELRKLATETAEAGKISGGRRDIVYQVSLLIKRGERERFEALLRRFSTHWKNQKSIECTGPWPPYSFLSRRVD
ncbi:MAG TPA: GvpL/GvpF family gas vesicle protein [Terriglobales bacterium]|nr:GvpL/GvpF family gas vesicle protein [Terriglobales bacterium]